MRKLSLAILAVLLGMMVISCQPSSKKSDQKVLQTHIDSISYIIGYDYGEGIANKNLTVSEDALVKGLLDGLKGQSSIPDTLINQLVVKFQKEIDRREDSLMKQIVEKTKAEGNEYLSKNKTMEGIVELADGLQYKVIKAGEGKSPVATDSVQIHFRAMFIDGRTFDMSYDSGPTNIRLSQMIKGLSEGIQLMKPGAIYDFYIPWYLAYGEEDFANVIPGGSTLKYHVELIKILK